MKVKYRVWLLTRPDTGVIVEIWVQVVCFGSVRQQTIPSCVLLLYPKNNAFAKTSHLWGVFNVWSWLRHKFRVFITSSRKTCVLFLLRGFVSDWRKRHGMERLYYFITLLLATQWTMKHTRLATRNCIIVHWISDHHSVSYHTCHQGLQEYQDWANALSKSRIMWLQIKFHDKTVATQPLQQIKTLCVTCFSLQCKVLERKCLN